MDAASVMLQGLITAVKSVGTGRVKVPCLLVLGDGYAFNGDALSLAVLAGAAPAFVTLFDTSGVKITDVPLDESEHFRRAGLLIIPKGQLTVRLILRG